MCMGISSCRSSSEHPKNNGSVSVRVFPLTPAPFDRTPFNSVRAERSPEGAKSKYAPNRVFDFAGATLRPNGELAGRLRRNKGETETPGQSSLCHCLPVIDKRRGRHICSKSLIQSFLLIMLKIMDSRKVISALWCIATSAGQGLEVEFVMAYGKTIALLTLTPPDVRLMREREILHVRELSAA